MKKEEMVKIWKEAWDETIIIMNNEKMRIANEEKPIRTEQQHHDSLSVLKENMESTCEQILSFLSPDDLFYEGMAIMVTLLKDKISLYYSLLLKSSINSQRTTRISKKLIKTQTLLYALLNYLKKIQEKEIRRLDSKYGTQA